MADSRDRAYDLPERRAFVFNVQKYNTYDGPGVRTVVFFKGCPLRCQWCSNPEGIEARFDVMFKRDACVNCGACAQVCPVGIHRFSAQSGHTLDRSRECTGCRACLAACPAAALEIVGEYKTISELLEVVMEDVDFYRFSGGGVTLGGGEVLRQPQAAIALLSACKANGVNTAIETSGNTSKEVILAVAEYVDLFLFDIKQMDADKHRLYTGVSNKRILENLATLLERRCKVCVRLPLLAGINDDQEEIGRICDFLKPYKHNQNFCGVNVLPYHKLGVGKYQQLDLTYRLKGDPVVSDETTDRIEAQFKAAGIAVKTLRH